MFTSSFLEGQPTSEILSTENEDSDPNPSPLQGTVWLRKKVFPEDSDTHVLVFDVYFKYGKITNVRYLNLL